MTSAKMHLQLQLLSIYSYNETTIDDKKQSCNITTALWLKPSVHILTKLICKQCHWLGQKKALWLNINCGGDVIQRTSFVPRNDIPKVFWKLRVSWWSSLSRSLVCSHIMDSTQTVTQSAVARASRVYTVVKTLMHYNYNVSNAYWQMPEFKCS